MSDYGLVTDKTIELWKCEEELLKLRIDKMVAVLNFIHRLKAKWFTRFIGLDNIEEAMRFMDVELEKLRSEKQLLNHKRFERQKKIYDRRNHIESEHIGDVAVNYKRKIDGLIK